jgi:hypothetical protein
VRPLLPTLGAMLGAKQPPRAVMEWRDDGGLVHRRVDCTAEIHRLVARAIIAVAAPGDPLLATARAVLAEPEPK